MTHEVTGLGSFGDGAGSRGHGHLRLSEAKLRRGVFFPSRQQNNKAGV